MARKSFNTPPGEALIDIIRRPLEIPDIFDIIHKRQYLFQVPSGMFDPYCLNLKKLRETYDPSEFKDPYTIRTDFSEIDDPDLLSYCQSHVSSWLTDGLTWCRFLNPWQSTYPELHKDVTEAEMLVSMERLRPYLGDSVDDLDAHLLLRVLARMVIDMQNQQANNCEIIVYDSQMHLRLTGSCTWGGNHWLCSVSTPYQEWYPPLSLGDWYQEYHSRDVCLSLAFKYTAEDYIDPVNARVMGDNIEYTRSWVYTQKACKGCFDTLEELNQWVNYSSSSSKVTRPSDGDCYGVGASHPYDIYRWSGGVLGSFTKVGSEEHKTMYWETVPIEVHNSYYNPDTMYVVDHVQKSGDIIVSHSPSIYDDGHHHCQYVPNICINRDRLTKLRGMIYYPELASSVKKVVRKVSTPAPVFVQPKGEWCEFTVLRADGSAANVTVKGELSDLSKLEKFEAAISYAYVCNQHLYIHDTIIGEWYDSGVCVKDTFHSLSELYRFVPIPDNGSCYVIDGKVLQWVVDATPAPLKSAPLMAPTPNAADPFDPDSGISSDAFLEVEFTWQADQNGYVCKLNDFISSDEELGVYVIDLVPGEESKKWWDVTKKWQIHFYWRLTTWYDVEVGKLVPFYWNHDKSNQHEPRPLGTGHSAYQPDWCWERTFYMAEAKGPRLPVVVTSIPGVNYFFKVADDARFFPGFTINKYTGTIDCENNTSKFPFFVQVEATMVVDKSTTDRNGNTFEFKAKAFIWQSSQDADNLWWSHPDVAKHAINTAWGFWTIAPSYSIFRDPFGTENQSPSYKLSVCVYKDDFAEYTIDDNSSERVYESEETPDPEQSTLVTFTTSLHRNNVYYPDPTDRAGNAYTRYITKQGFSITEVPGGTETVGGYCFELHCKVFYDPNKDAIEYMLMAPQWDLFVDVCKYQMQSYYTGYAGVPTDYTAPVDYTMQTECNGNKLLVIPYVENRSSGVYGMIVDPSIPPDCQHEMYCFGTTLSVGTKAGMFVCTPIDAKDVFIHTVGTIYIDYASEGPNINGQQFSTSYYPEDALLYKVLVRKPIASAGISNTQIFADLSKARLNDMSASFCQLGTPIGSIVRNTEGYIEWNYIGMPYRHALQSLSVGLFGDVIDIDDPVPFTVTVKISGPTSTSKTFSINGMTIDRTAIFFTVEPPCAVNIWDDDLVTTTVTIIARCEGMTWNNGKHAPGIVVHQGSSACGVTEWVPDPVIGVVGRDPAEGGIHKCLLQLVGGKLIKRGVWLPEGFMVCPSGNSHSDRIVSMEHIPWLQYQGSNAVLTKSNEVYEKPVCIPRLPYGWYNMVYDFTNFDATHNHSYLEFANKANGWDNEFGYSNGVSQIIHDHAEDSDVITGTHCYAFSLPRSSSSFTPPVPPKPIVYYTVTVDGGDHASASIAGYGQTAKVVDGTVISISATNIESGFKWLGWSNGETEQEFSMSVHADAYITVLVSAPETAKVTLSQDGHINILKYGETNEPESMDVYSKPFSVPEGVTMYAYANSDDEEWQFDGWYDGATKRSGETVITLTHADVGKTLMAKTIKRPVVTVSGADNCKVECKIGAFGNWFTYTEPFVVNKSTIVQFKCTPNEGKEFSKWTVSPSTTYTQNPVSFSVTGDVTVTPTVTGEQFSVTMSKDANHGTLYYKVNGGAEKTYSSAFNVTSGDEVTIRSSLDTGWEFDHWDIDGSVESGNPKNIKITKNTTAKAYYKEQGSTDTFTVTMSKAANHGSLSYKINGGSATSYSSSFTVNSGDTVTFITTVNSGYVFDHWDINGSTESGASKNYTITSNTTAKAYYKEQEDPSDDSLVYLTLTGDHSLFSVGGSDYIHPTRIAFKKGSDVSIWCGATEGWEYSYAYKDGTTTYSSNITFTNMQSDHDVSVVCTQVMCTLRVKAEVSFRFSSYDGTTAAPRFYDINVTTEWKDYEFPWGTEILLACASEDFNSWSLHVPGAPGGSGSNVTPFTIIMKSDLEVSCND